MRPQRIGLIALLTVLGTVAIDNVQLIPNPLSKIQNSQVLAQTPDARKAEADRLFLQGIQQYEQYQSEAALQSFQQALTIYQEIKDRQGEEVLQLYDSGVRQLEDERQTREAIETFKQLLVIAQQRGNRQLEVYTLINLGIAYYSLNQYQQAIGFYQQELGIARQLGNHQLEARAMDNLAMVFNAQGMDYDSQGQYQQAIDSYQQELEIARQMNDRKREDEALEFLGITYSHVGYSSQEIESHRLVQNQQEIKVYQQQLDIARKTGNQKDEAIALIGIGDTYSFLEEYQQAIGFYQQGLDVVRRIGDRKEEAYALWQLGSTYLIQEQYQKAIEFFKQSSNLAQQIDDYNRQTLALENLGIAYKFQRHYRQAIESFQQELEIARQKNDHKSEAMTLSLLGLIYETQGQYQQSIQFYQQQLDIARKIDARELEADALNGLGNVQLKSRRFVEAEQSLLAAIKVLETLRAGLKDIYKVSFFEQQVDTYKRLQEALVLQNKTHTALEISERGRARAFVELLASRLSENPKNKPTINPLNIQQIKDIAREQNATLVEYSIIDDVFKDKQELHESELYIWVISPTGVVTFRKVDLKPLWQKQNTTLADLVNSSRDSIGVRGLPIIGFRPRRGVQQKQEVNLTEQLQQLHKLLIEPITDLLPTDPNAHVIFLPQSSLFLVPFPALKDKDGKYLIEKHTILTAPSIQVLELTHSQRQREGAKNRSLLQGNDALVVGNPTMPSVPSVPGEKPQQLPSLPGAETEAKAIAEVLHTQPLIGNKATKSTVEQLMSKARFIHLATHGLLDDVRGLGSAIALAPDSSYKDEIGKVNGLLTAEEILDMKLNAELVVLSACNTGRGKITGDGVIGLSRSLISAGVPSVLVSLWSVPDAPTAQLMTEFYQNLQKNPDKAQALRQVMLTIMKQHPNPKDWAAFTLIGESN